MSSKIEKGQDLLNFARKEVEKFKAKELERLSSYTELGRRFECSMGGAYKYLAKTGVAEERRLLRKESMSDTLVPSDPLAWMLGILAGGGEVISNKHGGRVCLSSGDEDLLEKFRLIGQELFRTNPSIYKRYIQKNGRDYQAIQFFNRKIALILGDFRRTEWPNTLKEKYQWLFRNKQYLWSFLEGLFETRGSITLVDSKKMPWLHFNTNYQHIAVFITELLTRAGIKKPKIMYSNSMKMIRGVAVYNLHDTKLFSSNIHSISFEKEKKLEFFRCYQPKREILIEDTIQEWISLKRLLGHLPTYHEIYRLKREGKTKFIPDIYSYRFGKSEGKKSFVKARETLEKITRDGVQP